MCWRSSPRSAPAAAGIVRCSRWALADEPGGVSAATVRRRLSIVSGFFAFLQARGDVAANPVPRGLPTRRERSRPGQGVPLVRAVPAAAADLVPGRGRCADRGAAHAPGPGHGRGDGAGRAAPLRGPRAAAGGPAGGGAAGVHRRGQGRPAAADPGVGPVLRRGGRLPGRRAAARRRHRPGLRGAQGTAPRAAAVRQGDGGDPVRGAAPGRAGPRDLP